MSSGLSPVQIVAFPLAALCFALAFGLPTISLLKRAGAGQRVRDDGPQRHLAKEGTPTMGGLVIIGAAVAVSLVGQRWANGTLDLNMLTLLAITLAFACIGAADDWMKITRGRSLGLRARHKLLLQLIAAMAFVYALAGERAVQSALNPDSGTEPLSPGWAAFWILAVIATSNAMNLADGLDGLAAGLSVIAALGFAALGLMASNRQVAVLALVLAGGCAGFLAFNRHPAKLFMGDVGSLALGAAMAAMAARLNQPLALIGLCLVPFIEELSVIAQVISFKATGKRVFKMSPLHHHFELSGWSEQKVVAASWAVAAVAAALVLAVFAVAYGVGAALPLLSSSR